jgi:hypothetical protein
MRHKLFNKANIKAALKEHYSAPLEKTFTQFRLGSACFFCGGVCIWIALSSIEPSVKQEAALLLGVLLAGAGFLLAMLAQMRHIISRFVRFWSDD